MNTLASASRAFFTASFIFRLQCLAWERRLAILVPTKYKCHGKHA